MLRNYLEKMLGKPISVLMGNDNIGIIAKDNNYNYYITNTNFCIIKTTEDSAFEQFNGWKVC